MNKEIQLTKKQHLLSQKNLHLVKSKLNRSKSILLFLDYDGTLAPFKDNPDNAEALPGTIEIIKYLAEKDNIIISIISGREINNLQKMISLNGINYAGNHGLQIKMASGKNIFPSSNINTDCLEKIKKKLQNEYTNENLKLEDKGTGFAVHVKTSNIEKTIYSFLSDKLIDNQFEIIKGRQVIEVRPADWNKGLAVKKIISLICDEETDYQAIYIGDDTTDEDVFKLINDSINIYVKNEGNLKSCADFYLKNPSEVLTFLQKIKKNI